MLCLLAL